MENINNLLELIVIHSIILLKLFQDPSNLAHNLFILACFEDFQNVLFLITLNKEVLEKCPFSFILKDVISS